MKKIIDSLLKDLLICWWLFILHDSIFYQQTDYSQYEYYRLYLRSPAIIILLSCLTYIVISKKLNKVKIKFDKKDLEYCRENLDKICPSAISYLKNFNIEPEKDVAAHILKLLYQGYLKEENGILKRANIDIKKLSHADLEILRLIDNKYFSYQDYEKYTRQELIESGLIESKKSNLLKNIYIFCAVLLLYAMIKILEFIISFYFPTYDFLVSMLNNVSNIVTISGVPIIFIIASITQKYDKPYKRTIKGKELLKSMYGLKNFLLDFGNLEEKSYKEVYTRDYYLIYAVALGINQIIPREIEEMLNNKKAK